MRGSGIIVGFGVVVMRVSSVVVCLVFACQPLLAQDHFVQLPPSDTGIDFVNEIVDKPAHNILVYSNYYGGGGVGVGDFDGNGFTDLFFAGNLAEDAVYLNQGGMRFKRPRLEEIGVKEDNGWSSGVVVADVNQDGWPDIYVTRELYDDDAARRANLLYLNDGDGTFTEVAAACGIADEGRSRHATFLDYDGDGDLDLYVLNQPPNPGNYSPLLGTNLKDPAYRSKLYRNEGIDENGLPVFKETGPEAGVNEVGFPNSVFCSDLDNDGHTDMYVSHDYDAPDKLYHNNGDGTFTDILQQSIGHTSYYSMGIDGADINNDGNMDLMVLDMVAEDNYRMKANMSGMNPETFNKVIKAGGHYQYMFNTLQLNRGGNQFSEVAQLSGVAATDWSWSNLFADLDNDGYQDLYITNGLLRDIRNTDAAKEFGIHITQKINAYIAANPDDGDVTIYDVINLKKALSLIPSEPLPNYAFQGSGDFNFTNRAEDWGLGDPGFSSGSAYADLDNDGRLDLVVNNLNAPASVYHNKGTGGSYLRLKLVDPEHKSTFGTKVKISSGGEKIQHFETTNVRGMYSTSESTVHFGLGEDAGAKNGYGAWRVEVTWPDGTKDYADDVSSNFTLTVEKQGSGVVDQPAPLKPLLSDVTAAVELPYQHRENYFDDYRYQVLLPHKQSENGPGVAVGDVNTDGLDDLYLGGASGQPGELYLQRPSGGFEASSAELFRRASLQEDIAATFFDADGDGDNDLYVVSGGNEFEVGSPFYQDRLYLNDGDGKFSQAPAGSLPSLLTSGGCVRPTDFDNDGDLDLFVGGRLKPHDYPAPAQSHLLRNDNGTFTDVAPSLAPVFKELGLVTAAEWTDLDGDGRQDLLVVGEWMPLTVFYNREDGFVKSLDFTDSPSPTTGWWFSITKGDLDGDGDEDFVFGNLGENYKYKASAEEPFEVFYDDFDDNGKRDIVLSYYNDGKQFPLRGRACSAQQIPGLKEAFPSYSEFAGATMTDVFDPLALDKALQLSAFTFTTMVGINDNGKIRLVELPKEAQFSPVKSSVIKDIDGDGNADLLLGGNLYQSEVETPRADAGLGLLLLGDGKAAFSVATPAESGLNERSDVRAISALSNGLILVVNGNGKPKLYRRE